MHTSRLRKRRSFGARALGTAGPSILLAVLLGATLPPSPAFAGKPAAPLGSDEQLRNVPNADFQPLLRDALAEAGLTLADDGGYATKRTIDANTVQASRQDLAEALARGGTTANQRKVLDAYGALRENIKKLGNPRHAGQGLRAKLSPPPGLPLEFHTYLLGAIAWRAGDANEARTHFRAVLDLPADKRRYRSVWATYMLGRSCLPRDPDRARRWFARTRELADKGFKDSTDLAAATLGWEGKLHLDANRFVEAIACYAARYARSGAPHARVSLRICAAKVLRGPGVDPLAGKTPPPPHRLDAKGKALARLRLAAAARDPLARQVVTAHLAAGPSPGSVGSSTSTPADVAAWLEAMKPVTSVKPGLAARLAYAALRIDQVQPALAWVKQAHAQAPLACWIRAKLLLRDGEIPAAARQLDLALEGVPAIDPVAPSGQLRFYRYTPPDFRRRVAEELAALKLRDKQYADALKLLVRYGRRNAAAYVAERVLTTDELKAIVDAGLGSRPFLRLRAWLGRRLVREERWKDAKRYHPAPDEVATFQRLLQAARDGNAPPEKHADAAWKAATFVRDNGRSLLAYASGWYGIDRKGEYHDWHRFERIASKTGHRIAPPTADERRRAEKHAPPDPDRWHHAYLATDLAWQACQRMPDDRAVTARRLCEAGSWIKARDPQAADRFYKALVRRCPATDLGRRAAARKWFPPIGTGQID
jgi:hypothetical protein